MTCKTTVAQSPGHAGSIPHRPLSFLFSDVASCCFQMWHGDKTHYEMHTGL